MPSALGIDLNTRPHPHGPRLRGLPLSRVLSLLGHSVGGRSLIRNYLRVARRNLARHRGYTAISVAGLVIGIACCILILLFVRVEFSFQDLHPKSDRIYRVLRENTMAGTAARFSPGTSGAITPAMIADFPEVEAATRILDWGAWLEVDGKLTWSGFCIADPSFLEMFDYPLVVGDLETAFARPNSVIITESVAMRLFGEARPVGRTFTVDNSNYGGLYTVTAIAADMPERAHRKFDILTNAPPADGARHFRGVWENWVPTSSWRPFQNYVLLREGVTPEALEAKLPDFIARYMGDEIAATSAYRLQALDRMHLYSTVDFGFGSGGDIRFVYQLALIGAFVLVIACINFTNLATARAARRGREVALRKVVGANRSQLISQFLGEALLLTGFATVISCLIAWLALPLFNELIQRNLTLSRGLDWLLPGIPLLALFVSLAAGSYPALFISSFQPAGVLKGSLETGTRGVMLRKGLVVVQFAISIILIASTVAIYRQMQHMQQQDLGYDEELLVNVSVFFPDPTLPPRAEAVKRAFLSHPNVVNASACWPLPGAYVERHMVRPEGTEEDGWEMQVYGIDDDFLETYGIELVAGRNIDTSIASDSTDAFILNETAVRQLGWEEPVGKRFGFYDRNGYIIGVVKDFHSQSLHRPIEPAVLFYNWRLMLTLRIRGDDIPATTRFIEDTWRQFIPERPPDYYFLDDRIASNYRSDERLSQSCTVFAVIAILVASLGLVGLASYAAEQRTKEMGVRKVLGASTATIAGLFARDLMRLVLLANVVAWPISWFLMDRWLDGFAYRMGLSIEPFLLGSLLALLAAVLAVAYQVHKVASTQPVEALAYE